ncbi:NUDIX domain-containing protein [Paenibacillus sp. GCM10012307]|nr:NUDIX domain-containing protein [Paenibacillus roseus]
MSEIFDYYDEQMNYQGTALRSEVHRRGLWHQTIHCWVMQKREGRCYVWFQLRQSDKDTYPDLLDITVAGHLSAGETIEDGVRELEEELGIRASFSELFKLGEHREQLEGHVRGVPFIDRELSHVFGYASRVPLASLELQSEEVAGIFEAGLDEMIALFEGRLDAVSADGMVTCCSGELQPVQRNVRATDFVPRPSSYYSGMFRALAQHGLSV